MKLTQDSVVGGLFGLCIGDVLGLPVEGIRRAVLRDKPVEGLGYDGAVRDTPRGWWSDDSSLSFCLAESLCSGFDLQKIAEKYLRWLDEGYWTPGGRAFGIGRTTFHTLQRIRQGVPPTKSGGRDEYSNTNGSLMRILPLAFFLLDAAAGERFEKTHLISAITHAHPRSAVYTLSLRSTFCRAAAGKKPMRERWNLSRAITDTGRLLKSSPILRESSKAIYPRVKNVRYDRAGTSWTRWNRASSAFSEATPIRAPSSGR